MEHSDGETHNKIKEVQDSIRNDLIEEELGQRWLASQFLLNLTWQAKEEKSLLRKCESPAKSLGDGKLTIVET